MTSTYRRRLRRSVITTGMAVLLTAVAAVPAMAINPTTGVATVSAIPGHTTPGFNTTCTVNKKTQNCAQVRAQAQLGNTMFAGGSWAQVTDPATGKPVAAGTNLVAYNRLTGAVLTTFTPHTFNGMVRALAISPDGTTLYVGGEFTKMDCKTTNGKQTCTTAQHLVALSATTGKPVAAFQVNGKAVSNAVATNAKAAQGLVRALTVNAASHRLYVGGGFSSLEGHAVSQLAAIDLTTGAVITSFAPKFTIDTTQTNNVPEEVSSIAVGPGTSGGLATRVYAGGHFDYVNGKAQTTLVALNPASGATNTTFKPALQYQTNPYDQNQEGAGIVVVPDGSVLLAQGGHYNRGYRFFIGGKRMWEVNSGGDLQTVALSGNAVYFGGHFICWSNGTPVYRATCTTPPVPTYTVVRIHLAVVSLATGALDSNWVPLANPNTFSPYYYGCWTLFVSSAGDVYAGGLFKEIDSKGGVYPHAKLAVFPKL
jgi:hypothetical protein